MVPLLARLDAHDRALYQQLCLARESRLRSRLWWKTLTHAGGATPSILLVLVPLLFATGAWHDAAVDGAWTLAISHLVVHIAKRSATRPRPSHRHGVYHVATPDQFSFPSGHSSAAMVVALTYAAMFPAFAGLALSVAVLIGISRVRLGVHYPGDVVAGQLMAILTAWAVHMAR